METSLIDARPTILYLEPALQLVTSQKYVSTLTNPDHFDAMATGRIRLPTSNGGTMSEENMSSSENGYVGT